MSSALLSDRENNGIANQNMPNAFSTSYENSMNKTSMMFKGLIIFILTLGIAGLSRAETQQPLSASTIDTLTPRYESALAEGIDFTKPGYPGFLQTVTGVSQHEPWGRWTDGKEATFKFKKKLPKKFTLELTAQAFGPNVNAPLSIQIGKVKKQLTITDGQPKLYRLTFDGINADTLTFVPAKPTAPKSIGVNEDTRLLGVGLINLKIR